MVCTIDFCASFAKLTAQSLAEQDCVDSLNVLDALLGKQQAKGRDHLVSQNNGDSALGLRVGDWKLLHHKSKKAMNVAVEQKLARTNVPEFQLFNLANDPSEQKNVMAENAAVAERMKKRLKQIVDQGRTRTTQPAGQKVRN